LAMVVWFCIKILTCFCLVPMVGLMELFIWLMILATSRPAESSPTGKITFAAGISIWFHLTEGGLPPNSWALVKVAVAVSSSSMIGRGRIRFIKGESSDKLFEPAYKELTNQVYY